MLLPKLRYFITFYSLCGLFSLFGCTQSPAQATQTIPFQTATVSSPMSKPSRFVSTPAAFVPPTETPPPTILPSKTPYPTPTFPSWPTPTGNQQILPAPLHFVSAYEDKPFGINSQIVRFEKDGKTITPIIHSVNRKINGFDISPTDGSIIFAAQGSLWLADAKGENIKRLITGLPNPEGTDSLFEIRDPAWSPDGNQIVYADGGIRILDLASGARIDVIENSNFDHIGFGNSWGQYGIWFHSPFWSPDGEAILFSKQTPTSPTRMLYIPRESKLDEVPGTLGVWGNNIAWSHDGMALFLDYSWSANVAGIPEIEPAFIRISRNDFNVQTLWPHGHRADPVFSSRSNNPYQVLYPFEASDGRILFFQAEPCDSGSCYNYSLVEGVFTGTNFKTRILRRNALPDGVRDIVWHNSGKFVALLINSWSDWFIATMNVDTGEILLLSQEDERPCPIIWGNP